MTNAFAHASLRSCVPEKKQRLPVLTIMASKSTKSTKTKKAAPAKQPAKPAASTAIKVWPGDLTTLCSCIMKVFEKTQTNLDNFMLKKVKEKQSSGIKVAEVLVGPTDNSIEIRRQTDWEGSSRKERNSLHLAYWGIRTERQDSLLAEIALRIFKNLKEQGFTHVRVPNTDNNTNTTNTDNNNKKRKIEAQKEEGLLKLEGMRVGGSRIVPKAVVRQVTGITGDWPIPDASGVALLYLLIDSEAEKPVPYAVNLGYAQYHPTPMDTIKPSITPSPTIVNTFLASSFLISPEADMLSFLSSSSKPIYPQELKEIEATKKSLLFKKKLDSFFEQFSIESADIKATGNADFEHHNYPSALLWYTLGIAFELNNPESELLHVYYGNRSATYYQMQEYQKALEDADEVIRVAPHWPKGYLRKSAVLVALGQKQESQLVLDQMEQAEKANEEPKNKKRKT